MAKVTGLGGIFVKTADPERLKRFYREALGVEVGDWGAKIALESGGDERPYNLWSPFERDSAHFAPSTREFMVNLRVDDLAGVLERVRAFGAEVLDRGERSEFGDFGYVLDPDGTLLELWQPPAKAPRAS